MHERVFNLLRGIFPLTLYVLLIYCPWCAWLLPCWCIAVWYAIAQAPYWRTRYIIVWSMCAAVCLLFPLLVIFYALQVKMAAVYASILLVYATLFIGLVVVSIQQIFMSTFSLLLRIISIACLFCCWWYVLDTSFFIPFGIPCGHRLANPFLTCVELPLLKVFLPYMGRYGVMFCLLWVSGVFLLYNRCMRWYGVVLCVGGFYSFDRIAAQRWPQQKTRQHRVVALTPLPDSASVLERVVLLQQQYDYWAEQIKVPDLMVSCESYLPCALNNEPVLSKVLIQQKPYVVLGSWQQKGTLFYKTLFIVQQGRIIFSYDKQFLLPFLECCSPVCGVFPFLQGLFFTQEREFAAGARQDICELTVHNISYTVRTLICSDFFCQTIKPPLGKNPLLLLLVNDAGCLDEPTARAMLRDARVWAVEQGTPIIYCGRRYACWIEPSGCVIPLMQKER